VRLSSTLLYPDAKYPDETHIPVRVLAVDDLAAIGMQNLTGHVGRVVRREEYVCPTRRNQTRDGRGQTSCPTQHRRSRGQES